MTVHISIERIKQLEEEAYAVIRSLEKIEHCGDSDVVTLDSGFAKGYGISKHIRLTLREGQYQLRGAPAELDRTQYYKPLERSLTSFADDWAAGRKAEIPESALLPVVPPVPVPSVQKFRPSSAIGKIEKKLFSILHDHGDTITVVNPSFGTMSHLMPTTGLVCLTAMGQHDWKEDVKDFITKSKGRIRYTDRIMGTAYLGSHNPEHLVGGQWFYLLPNPYTKQDWEAFVLKEDVLGVAMRYQKKGRAVRGDLPNNLPFFVYSPATLAQYTGDSSYIMVANYPFPWPGDEADYDEAYHTPFFLAEYPDFVEENVNGHRISWSRRGRVVFDVVAQGTYLSRRARIVLPEGYQWAPLVEMGPFSFSRFARYPRLSNDIAVHTLQDPDKDVVTKYTVFGGVRPVMWSYQDQQVFVPVLNILVPPVAICRNISAFVSDAAFGIPDAGLSPGILLKFSSFTHEGKVYVLHEDFEYRSVTLFSHPSGYAHYKISFMSNSFRWARLNEAKLVDMELLGMKPRGQTDQVLDLLSIYKIKDWGDKGVSISQVSDRFPTLTRHQIRHMFLAASCVQWRNDEMLDDCEFVAPQSVFLVLPTKDPPIGIDGYELRDVLSRIRIRKYNLFTFTDSPEWSRFLQFCRTAGWAVLDHGVREGIRSVVVRR